MNEEKILDFTEYSHSVEKKEALFAYIKDKKIIEEALNRFCFHFSVRNYGLKDVEKHLESKFTFLVKNKQETDGRERVRPEAAEGPAGKEHAKCVRHR